MLCDDRKTLSQGALLCVLAGALSFTPSQALAHPDVKSQQTVIGKWRFTAALDGADIASLDERQAQQLVGQLFKINKDSVRFGDRDCGPSDFKAVKVEPNMFLRAQFHADAAKLHLPNPVTVVDLSCTSVFIKGSDRLVIAWKGWFFEAVRMKP